MNWDELRWTEMNWGELSHGAALSWIKLELRQLELNLACIELNWAELSLNLATLSWIETNGAELSWYWTWIWAWNEPNYCCRIIECGLRDDGTICECRAGDLERSTSNLQSTASHITSIKPSLPSTSSQSSSVQSTSFKSSVPLQSTSNIRTAQQGGSNLRSSPTNCRFGFNLQYF